VAQWLWFSPATTRWGFSLGHWLGDEDLTVSLHQRQHWASQIEAAHICATILIILSSFSQHLDMSRDI
jgi:hypothetical protein